MKNVISFPEERMKQTQRRQKTSSRQAVVSLSMVSLILGALLLNDSLIRASSPQYIVADNMSSSDIQNLNRAIASARPMNMLRDLEWERKMARRLGQDPIESRTPASVGKTANALEQLRFGPLAGKYQVLSLADQSPASIREIAYVDSSEVNDRPVYLDPDSFLKQYGSLLSVEFDLFDRANPAQSQIREYRLLNSSKAVVGTAAFVMDDEGRFLSLKIRSASENSQ